MAPGFPKSAIHTQSGHLLVLYDHLIGTDEERIMVRW
jgi:hypothetical protein